MFFFLWLDGNTHFSKFSSQGCISFSIDVHLFYVSLFFAIFLFQKRKSMCVCVCVCPLRIYVSSFCARVLIFLFRFNVNRRISYNHQYNQCLYQQNDVRLPSFSRTLLKKSKCLFQLWTTYFKSGSYYVFIDLSNSRQFFSAIQMFIWSLALRWMTFFLDCTGLTLGSRNHGNSRPRCYSYRLLV